MSDGRKPEVNILHARSVVNVNALFIMEVDLAIKLVHRHSTFNNLKETIFNITETWLRTPFGRRQPVGYLQSAVELNPGQPETNPDHRLERDLNPGQPDGNPTTGPRLSPTTPLSHIFKLTVSTSENILNNTNVVVWRQVQ